MSLFKPYQSKPIERMAIQITEEDCIIKLKTIEATYKFFRQVGDSDSTVGTKTVTFKAYEEPKVGDWIVRLTDEDTYHVTNAVFRERNVVPE